jgi:hypothetical protein
MSMQLKTNRTHVHSLLTGMEQLGESLLVLYMLLLH